MKKLARQLNRVARREWQKDADQWSGWERKREAKHKEESREQLLAILFHLTEGLTAEDGDVIGSVQEVILNKILPLVKKDK